MVCVSHKHGQYLGTPYLVLVTELKRKLRCRNVGRVRRSNAQSGASMCGGGAGPTTLLVSVYHQALWSIITTRVVEGNSHLSSISDEKCRMHTSD